jgi:hypothetical protein
LHFKLLPRQLEFKLQDLCLMDIQLAGTQ